MDAIWLNRIGIILSFFAGFLIAPELVGLERLGKLEIALRKSLEAKQSYLTSMFIDRSIDLTVTFVTTNRIGFALVTTLFEILTALLTIISIISWPDFRKYILFAGILVEICLYISILWRAWKWIGNDLIYLGQQSLARALYFLYLRFPWVCFWTDTALLFTFLIGFLVLIPLDAMTNFLCGNQRLRALFITIGIIFYVAGNVFQFLGTF